MTYDYRCPSCQTQVERSVPSAQRDEQTCWCGVKMTRLSHFRQVVINQPKGFMTSKELVMGPPGSKARDAFEADIRSGKTVPAGPGSRWV